MRGVQISNKSKIGLIKQKITIKTLIQFLTHWIFEPLVSFLEYVLEIRFFPIIALIGLTFLFSAKNIEQN